MKADASSKISGGKATAVGSGPGRWIVCEPTSRWAVALGRHLSSKEYGASLAEAGGGIDVLSPRERIHADVEGFSHAAGESKIHQTRSLPDAWSLIQQYPASFLVVELTTANVEPLLERLATFPRDFPWACVAIVAARSMAEYEELVRELGAAWFTVSSREMAAIAELGWRHLRRAPPLQGSITERILSSLPWTT